MKESEVDPKFVAGLSGSDRSLARLVREWHRCESLQNINDPCPPYHRACLRHSIDHRNAHDRKARYVHDSNSIIMTSNSFCLRCVSSLCVSSRADRRRRRRRRRRQCAHHTYSPSPRSPTASSHLQPLDSLPRQSPPRGSSRRCR